LSKLGSVDGFIGSISAKRHKCINFIKVLKSWCTRRDIAKNDDLLKLPNPGSGLTINIVAGWGSGDNRRGSNPSLSARMPCKKVHKLQNVDFQFFALFYFWQMVQKKEYYSGVTKQLFAATGTIAFSLVSL
jgi:hypothetical protein